MAASGDLRRWILRSNTPIASGTKMPVGKVCAALYMTIPGATMALTTPSADMSMTIPSANIDLQDCN